MGSLVSSGFGVFNNVFYPITFMYLLRKRAGPLSQPQGTLSKLLDIIILVMGVFTMIFGIQGSLNSLMSKLNAAAAGLLPEEGEVIRTNKTTTTTTTTTTFTTTSGLDADDVLATATALTMTTLGKMLSVFST